MVTENFLNELNAAYQQLEMKCAQVMHALQHRVFTLEAGWYNGHYHRDDSGEWQMESYPIRVVGVKDLCDIEISFNKITLSTKLKREKALEYDYAKLAKCNFEMYGVEDYLCDFYKQGMTIAEMKDAIGKSEETEIGFAFFLPEEMQEEELYEFVTLLRREGFYY